MGEINIPFVGRYIGAFGQITQITKITMIHDLTVITFRDAIDFHRFRLIDQVKQRGKGIAEADAAAATVADIENAFELGIELRRVVVCPDEIETISQDLSALRSSHDLVFTSGGVEGVQPPAGIRSTIPIRVSFGGTGDGAMQFDGPEGVAYFQLTMKGGRRCSSAAAYLKPVRDRSNLRIVTDALRREFGLRSRLQLVNDPRAADLVLRGRIQPLEITSEATGDHSLQR